MSIGAGLHGIICWRLASSIELKRIPVGFAGFVCMRELQHQIRSSICVEKTHLCSDYVSEVVDVFNVLLPCL